MNTNDKQEFEVRVWRAITDAWWERFGTRPVVVMDLFNLPVVSSIWGYGHSEADRRAFAWALRKRVGDFYSGKTIQVASSFIGPRDATYKLTESGFGFTIPFDDAEERTTSAPISASVEHRVDSGWFGEPEDIMLCPVCGYSYTHINGVESIPTVKGHRVTIQMNCEMNHEFQIVMNQHKGEVSLSVSDAKRTERVSGSGKEPRS